ncbi:hypothetical protein VOLCADRAFT_87753 [Volvox carteri f. nagariensis]|uniref:Uncharacterized protein n=1 Tax=Volvox carteri f. nagariensis TaxID=3068 RepID=D8TM56_VOLCA|nr:uncharacterized protein VOLCADRAFT_87753 [Volvox carteri f. nagariensis]EFJ51585.1 hypothetical protein VOLCADRAFT_87753 [Volvox carteri f. nagariensis]|eukprot:XP_002947537.1 hypothetical protein VOLCADRAFT_87753 [Volvox carteri f. nagariensis]
MYRAKPPPEPVQPPPPVGPVQEVHLVLKVRLRLKPPAPEPPPQAAWRSAAVDQPVVAGMGGEGDARARVGVGGSDSDKISLFFWRLFQKLESGSGTNEGLCPGLMVGDLRGGEDHPPPPHAPSPPPDPTPPGKGGKGNKSPPKKPSTPASARKKAAAAAAAAAAEAAAAAAAAALAKPVDPATLVLTVKYTPFTGAEQVLGPIKPVKPELPAPPADTVAAAALPLPAPTAAAPPQAGAAAANLPYATVDVEHHVKVAVDEAAVRSLAAAHGMLALTITMATPAPEGDAPPSKPKALAGSKSRGPGAGPEARPPTPMRNYSAVVMLDCSGLLVGEKAASSMWPDKTKGIPTRLEEVAESLEADIQLLSIPPPPPPPPPTPPSAKGKRAPAAQKKKEEEPPPPPELKDTPGDPIGLLHPELITMLNPIVVSVRKSRVVLPPPSTCAGSRYILFGQPEVFLAGDLPGGGEGALALCRESPLLVEVHDRTAIPEPPEFAVMEDDDEEEEEEGGDGVTAAPGTPTPEGALTAKDNGGLPESEGYVCGLARVSLLDLARGYTHFKFNVNLAPHTTVRGAASLDWTKRPGNYVEAGSVLKGEVRCAAPLSATRGTDPSLRVFSRALFIMDYRDSDLFHMLEDILRKNNAWKLGLKAPSDKLAPELLPPEMRKKALEAAGGAGEGDETKGDPRLSISSGSSLSALHRRSSSLYSVPELAARGSIGPSGGLGPDRSGRASPGPLPRRESLSPPTYGAMPPGMLVTNDSKRHVLFDTRGRAARALSTTQLTPDQASDRSLDLLTGWHLVDGRERVIVVEGLAEGAMKIVKGIADWALEDPKPEESWRRRCVLFSSSPSVRTASRLYAPLGVDLWIVKLRAPLNKLLGEPGSFATGRGLRRLGTLRSVTMWARQAYDMSLWPSPLQLQLVDKKFGGELMAADVLGVEPPTTSERH